MKTEELNLTTYKILYCVKELNNIGVSPNHIGVYKVLAGILEDETRSYQDLMSWSILISLSQKRITTLINALCKKGYLDKKMATSNGEYYFTINKKTISDMTEFINHHKVNFKRSKKTAIKNFVEIDNLV